VCLKQFLETYFDSKLGGNKMSKSSNDETLLKLYKELNNIYEKLYTMELSELSLNSKYYQLEIIKLKQQIKELENDE
jgi:hypothetical protein